MAMREQNEFLKFLENLNDYDRRFQQLILNRNQFELFSLLGKDIFLDFPNNLPADLLTDYFGRRYLDVYNEIKKRGLEIDNLEESEKLYQLYLTQIDSEKNISKVGAILGNIHQTSRYYLNMQESTWPDFENIRLSQEIISSYSIAEGFIVDSVRQIVSCIPDSVYDDKYIYNLCYGQIGEKLKVISKEFHLDLELSDKQKFDLKRLAKTRNLIIHNASKADEKWINYFKSDINIDDVIIFDVDIIEDLLDNLIDSMQELYYKVSIKYIKKEEKFLFPKLIDAE